MKRAMTCSVDSASSSSKAQLRKAAKLIEEKTELQAELARISYRLLDGVRTVLPYVYTFETYAKQRWYQRNLLDILTTEFGANSKTYYLHAIASGRLRINHKLVSAETLIKNGDLITHLTHRHEPPVSAEPVVIYHEDDEVLTVSKPPTIPVHPCGSYRYTSLHYLIHHDRPDLTKLHVVHRLDRLTSGLVIFGKNIQITFKKRSQLGASIVLDTNDPYDVANRQVQKTYLARVRGEYPHQDHPHRGSLMAGIELTAKSICNVAKLTWLEDGSLRIQCPLRCIQHKDGINECHQDGKDAETVVEFHSSNGKTTALKCRPVTGRTHQIRLHLQLLGLPIANDPCYGGELHYGKPEAALKEFNELQTSLLSASEVDDDKNLHDYEEQQRKDETEEDFMKRTCEWCKVGSDRAFKETQLHCDGIWLHALNYKINGKEYSVPEPKWASASFRW